MVVGARDRSQRLYRVNTERMGERQLVRSSGEGHGYGERLSSKTRPVQLLLVRKARVKYRWGRPVVSRV